MAGKLSEEELFQCLKSLNVPVRLNDVNTPSRDFIIRVFDCFLRDQQIDISSQSARNFEAIKHIEHPDMFQEGQILIQLVTLINKITSVYGLILTIRDIIEPKPKRTKRMLNYLILFWKYSLQKNIIFQNVEQSLMEEKKQVDDLQDEISSLQIRKEECLSILDKMDPSKEELQSCVSSKIEKTKELEKQYKAVTDEYELVLKKREKDLDEKKSSLDVNILSMKEKINEVDQLILPSPDRLSTELQRIKDVIKNEEIKIREKEIDLKDKRKRQDTLSNSNELNQKSLEVLGEMKRSLEEISNTIDLFLSGHHTLENEEAQLKKVVSELEKKDKLKSIHMEKEMKISLNTKKQKESIEEALVSLKKKKANEFKILELLKSTKVDIQQKTDEDVDSVIEMCSLVKQAESLTEKKYAEYSTQMEAIYTAFFQDCEEVKGNITKTFKP